MKRVIVLTLAMCLLLCGCSFERADAKTDDATDIGDLIAAYREIPNGGILDVDHSSLLSLGDLMYTTKYRVCGVLTEIEDKSWASTAWLVVGEEKIWVSLEKGQSLIDGEYVEIVGRILLADTDCVSLTDCTITDRGSSVRDRLESEE